MWKWQKSKKIIIFCNFHASKKINYCACYYKYFIWNWILMLQVCYIKVISYYWSLLSKTLGVKVEKWVKIGLNFNLKFYMKQIYRSVNGRRIYPFNPILNGGVFLPPPNELSQISEILRRPKACAFLYVTKN